MQNANFMKNKKSAEEIEMLPEYDFTNKTGVRGKYHQAYQAGHEVRVHESDGEITIRYFTLEEGAIMLEPDVRKYFSTSESVNDVLRMLISLRPVQESA